MSNYRNEMPSLNTTLNLWEKVKSDIEVKIIKGEYAVGYKIPTIVELQIEYGIGKTTAQKIVSELYKEGTIVKKVGVGCFVKPFVKERLLEKHKVQLEIMTKELVKEAQLLNLDYETIISVFSKLWSERENN